MRILDSSVVKPVTMAGSEYQYKYKDLEVFCMKRGDICESPKYMYGTKISCERWFKGCIDHDGGHGVLWLYKDTSEPYDSEDDETWGLRPKQGPTENEWGEIGA